VIGPDFFDDVVLRKRKTLSLRQLLQRRLVVLEQEILDVDRLQIFDE
jgi:hypothetical protein